MATYDDVFAQKCEDVQRTMSNNASEDIEWDTDVEILLLEAMINLKPVGMNRYFMMASIHNRFSHYIDRQITSKPIWEWLDSMYDLNALNESEILPVPTDESDFELPADEYDKIALRRLGVTLSEARQMNQMNKAQMAKETKVPYPKASNTSGKIKDVEFLKPYPVTNSVPVKPNKSAAADSRSSDDKSSSNAHGTQHVEAIQHTSVKSEQSGNVQVKKTVTSDKSESQKKAEVKGSPSSSSKNGGTRSSKDTKQENADANKRKRSKSESKKSDTPAKRIRN